MHLLVVFVICAASESVGEILSLAWQQYYPSTQSWSHHSTTSYQQDSLSLRPPRIRVGQGRYRLIPPASAELNCDFPDSMLMISNVVWERADIGSRDLHQIYKRAGVPHQYDVHIRPRGSTLHIFDVTPLDRGMYRCIATGMDPGSNTVVTLFQDTEFFPEQTLPLTNLIKRDYIVPAASASSPVYHATTYSRPTASPYYSGYSTVPYSPSFTTSAGSPTSHSLIHSSPGFSTSHSHPSYPTSSTYTVDSDFVYSNGNSIKPDEHNTNKIYVYDKSYLYDKPVHAYDKPVHGGYMTERLDNGNGTSTAVNDDKQGGENGVDYRL